MSVRRKIRTREGPTPRLRKRSLMSLLALSSPISNVCDSSDPSQASSRRSSSRTRGCSRIGASTFARSTSINCGVTACSCTSRRLSPALNPNADKSKLSTPLRRLVAGRSPRVRCLPKFFSMNVLSAESGAKAAWDHCYSSAIKWEASSTARVNVQAFVWACSEPRPCSR